MTNEELKELCAEIALDSRGFSEAAQRIRAIQLPEDNSLKMIPMKSEEYPNRKYWYIDTPEFYCDIEINEGEVSIFFRDRKSEQEDFCSENINLQLPVEVKSNLPDRDESKTAEEQGLFNKFTVIRNDGSDLAGGKHHGCEYFVLDIAHDKYAKAALLAYARECKHSHPDLSKDMIARYGLPKQSRKDFANSDEEGGFKDLISQFRKAAWERDMDEMLRIQKFIFDLVEKELPEQDPANPTVKESLTVAALEKQIADLKESVTFFLKVMDLGKKNGVLKFDAAFAAKIETAREQAK